MSNNVDYSIYLSASITNRRILGTALFVTFAIGMAWVVSNNLSYEDVPSAIKSVSTRTDSSESILISPTLSNIPEPDINSEPENATLELGTTNNPHSVLVQGYITTEYGELPAQSKIKLYSSSLNRVHFAKSMNTGNFQFDNVIPATDYQLTVTPKGMFHRYREENVRIHPNQPQLLITLGALPVGALNGLVVNTDGIPIPGFDVNIRSKTKTLWNHDATSNSIGQFTLENVPIGGLDFSSMLGQVFSTTGYTFLGNEQSLITLVVDNGPHDITGLVLDKYNEPIPGANVIFGWKTSSVGTSTASYRRTITNPNGYFSVTGVGPGMHDLVVSDSTGATARKTVNVIYGVTDITILLTDNPLLN